MADRTTVENTTDLCSRHGPYNHRRVWKSQSSSYLIQTCPTCDEDLQGTEVVCPHCGKGFSTKPQAIGSHDIGDDDRDHKTEPKKVETAQPVAEAAPIEGDKRGRSVATDDDVRDPEQEMAVDRVPAGGVGKLGDEGYTPPDAPDA